jgi:nitrous oxidase accessory protein
MIVKKNIFKFVRIYFLVTVLILYSFNNFSIIKTCKAFEIDNLFVGGFGDKNYTKIHDAIDDSKENDTIIVYSGTYNESIVVNKSINLIGLNVDNVIINGNDSLYVILIKSSYVNISGFTIKGGKIGIFISEPEFKFNNFSGNNITNNTEGIRFVNTSNNKIFNNIIQFQDSLGIVLYESFNNVISENFLINNGEAICINKWSENNIIQKNNLTENDVGISLDFSFNNLVNENYIGNNNYGIYLTNSKTNNITNNNIEFNKECGIFISNSDDNEISPNVFLKNNQDIKLDAKPPEIKAPGFEFLFFFVAIFLYLRIKKYI